MELQLADAIDLHPEFSVNISCQRMESADQEKGHGRAVSPLQTKEPLLQCRCSHFLKSTVTSDIVTGHGPCIFSRTENVHTLFYPGGPLKLQLFLLPHAFSHLNLHPARPIHSIFATTDPSFEFLRPARPKH